MKLNQAGIFFAVLLSFAMGADAASVSTSEAEAVSRAFVARKNTLGVRLGASVDSAVEQSTTNGATFFTVKMRGGGTIITSGDTELDPIVAILPGDGDYSTIDRKSPLWALLNRDLSSRKVMLEQAPQVPVVQMASVRRAKAASVSRGKWESLLEEDERRQKRALSPMIAFAPMISDVDNIGDLRVDALVETKWGQIGRGENYYTTNSYVCGCVATAMAQIMRYHCWPTNDVSVFSTQCSVDGESVWCDSKGGVFDWANMPLEGGKSETEKKAIGKLTYDCGVSVNMGWTSEGSGAATYYVGRALKQRFSYKGAIAIEPANGVDTSVENLGKIMFSCFDAGCPVQLGIRDSEDPYSGHSVVGDGYGFVDDLAYVHINMGWNGAGDAWYNLPEIEYTATYGGTLYKADTISTCVYNIFPTQSSDTTYILSGRALDDEGLPIANASVTVYDKTGKALTNMTTSANGIWAAFVRASSTYDVEAKNAAGDEVGLLEGVKVLRENSWGHDIEVSTPTVRIGAEAYSTLDAALAAAKDGDLLEVLAPTKLRRSTTLNVSCTILATNEDAQASAVDVFKGASLTVASGVRLKLENIVMTNNAAVVVRAGGKLALSGWVEAGSVTTSDAAGLELEGAITQPISVTAPNMDLNGVIGTCAPIAASSASLVINPDDAELVGCAVDGVLKWGVKEVSDEDAVLRLEQDGNTMNFSSFRMMLKCMTKDATVTLLKNANLGAKLTITNDLTLVGDRAERLLLPVENTSTEFSVAPGGTLVITNLTLKNFVGEKFINVIGGELRLEQGATLDTIATRDEKEFGPITLWSGKVTMCSGATIRKCSSAAFGGAICAWGGQFDLEGGTIANCHSVNNGGGIYAYIGDGLGEFGAKVSIGGDLCVRGNSSEGASPDNVFLAGYYSDYPITVTSALTTSGAIGIRYGEREQTGGVSFALLSPAVAATSVRVFTSDANGSTVTPIVSQTLLDWKDKTPELEPEEYDNAVVRVIYENGVTNYYDRALTAFSCLADRCVVELLIPTVVNGSAVTISHDVTIRTAPELSERAMLWREGDFSYTIPTGVSVVLTNVCVAANPESSCNSSLLWVEGELTLDNGASVSGVYFNGNTHGNTQSERCVSGIVVWKGTLTMKSGSLVENCRNMTVDYIGWSDTDTDANAATGAGILLDGATAYFLGGTVTNCRAMVGCGISVGNESKAYVSGDFVVAGNTRSHMPMTENDMVVEDYGTKLVLAGPLSAEASIGRLCGLRADTNQVAVVPQWTNQWTAQSLALDAEKFFSNDFTDITGVAVTNATDDALIVWSTALASDGTYTAPDGTVYHFVNTAPGPGPSPEPVPPAPIAFKSFVREADMVTLVITDAVQWCNYSIFATNTLEGGFVITNAAGNLIVEPVTNFQWQSTDKEMSLTLPAADGLLYWKATATEAVAR